MRPCTVRAVPEAGRRCCSYVVVRRNVRRRVCASCELSCVLPRSVVFKSGCRGCNQRQPEAT
eukprot:2722530-Prymnesium_polylepis.1